MTDQPETLEAKVAKVIELCQRYSHPGVNAGAHAMANKVLEILGGGK